MISNRLSLVAMTTTALLLVGCDRTAEPEGAGDNRFVNFSVVVSGEATATKGTMLDSSSDLSKISATAWNNDGSDHGAFISGYRDFTLTAGKATTDVRWKKPYAKIFYAYANLPADGANVTSSTYDGQTFTYTVPDDASDQNDILMGVYSGDGGSDCVAEITLKHALTSVVFKSGTIEGVEKITSITIDGVYASGSVTQGSNGSFSAWSGATSGKTVTQTITESLPESGSEIGVPFILIPQTKPDGLSVDLELTLKDNTTMICTGTLGSTAAGLVWEAGKTNTYTVSYDAGKGLVFSTPVVTDWGVEGTHQAEFEDDPSPYVEISAKYDGTTVSTLKWYKENLAITASGHKEFYNSGHINGDYFQWGTHIGYCGSASDPDKGLLIYTSFTSSALGDSVNGFTFKTTPDETPYQFWWKTDGDGVGKTPYCENGGSTYSFTKYTSSDQTLELQDDPANIVLGGTWRLATFEECIALVDATFWVWDDTDHGCYVFNPDDAHAAGSFVKSLPSDLDKKNALLFFPAAGGGNGKDILGCGSQSRSLTSTLKSGDMTNFMYPYFTSGGVSRTNAKERFNGHTVRPVSE